MLVIDPCVVAKSFGTREVFQDADQPSLKDQECQEAEGVPRFVEGCGWIGVCMHCAIQLVKDGVLVIDSEL